MRLGFLQDVYEQRMPYATVYLDTSGDAEDAGKAIQLRWRHARDQLAQQGASEKLLRAVDEELEQPQRRTGQRGEVIVANEDGVVFSDDLPEPPRDLSDDEKAHLGPVPDLFPYLRMRGSRIPHLIAVVDHQGADITEVNAHLRADSESVQGTADVLHKARTPSGPGAEERHQSAVEENWKINAEQVADAIDKRAAEIGAEAVVLAGDPQQRTLVLEQLRKGTQPLVVESEHGYRDNKASDEGLQQDVAETVQQVVDSRTNDVVTDFERERGERSRAAEGWESTVAALQHGQVETLMRAVPDRSERPAELYVGPGNGEVALRASDLGDQAEAAPADSALVRGLVDTSASLVFVDPGQVELEGGIGAVLRFTESG